MEIRCISEAKGERMEHAMSMAKSLHLWEGTYKCQEGKEVDGELSVK